MTIVGTEVRRVSPRCRLFHVRETEREREKGRRRRKRENSEKMKGRTMGCLPVVWRIYGHYAPRLYVHNNSQRVISRWITFEIWKQQTTVTPLLRTMSCLITKEKLHEYKSSKSEKKHLCTLPPLELRLPARLRHRLKFNKTHPSCLVNEVGTNCLINTWPDPPWLRLPDPPIKMQF